VTDYAAPSMQCDNPWPAVGKGAMATITGLGRVNEVSATLQHRMGSRSMGDMAIKVGGVASGTLTTSQMTGSTTLQYTRIGGVTRRAGQMDLASTYKWTRGGVMTSGSDTVDSRRSGDRVHLH